MAHVAAGRTERVVCNRRKHPRVARDYEAALHNEDGCAVFHGRSVDISRSGAKLAGLPCSPGVTRDQPVCVDFLTGPRSGGNGRPSMRVSGRVCWIQNAGGCLTVGIEFDQLLDEPF